MEKYRKTISNRIKNLRNMRGLTQHELAKKLNIEKSMISHYETGKYTPSAEVLINLAKALDASVDHILFENIPFKPLDQKLNNNLEALLSEIKKFDNKDQEMVKHMIVSLIQKNSK